MNISFKAYRFLLCVLQIGGKHVEDASVRPSSSRDASVPAVASEWVRAGAVV